MRSYPYYDLEAKYVVNMETSLRVLPSLSSSLTRCAAHRWTNDVIKCGVYKLWQSVLVETALSLWP